MMINVRNLDLANDREQLAQLDATFETSLIYTVTNNGGSMWQLEMQLLPTPLRKDYGFANELDTLPAFEHVLVATSDQAIVGVAAFHCEQWNQRAVLWHCYVDAAWRGRGVGRALINAVITVARDHGMRCVWLETQNINYPAIQFYRSIGFAWCGLDTSLYMPHGATADETALFFVYSLPQQHGA